MIKVISDLSLSLFILIDPKLREIFIVNKGREFSKLNNKEKYSLLIKILISSKNSGYELQHD